MIEPGESLSAYCARVFDRKLGLTIEADRLALVAIIHDIVNVFFMATADALTPDNSRSRPAGGRIYDLEHWINPPGLPAGFEFEYDDRFASVWQPADHEVEQFLTERELSLATPGTALQAHHAWLGRAATNLAGSKLLSLENDVDVRRECPQWQEEFKRLAPLLQRSLDAEFLQTLVETLARLSRTLLLEETARSHEPFVQALLEREASRF